MRHKKLVTILLAMLPFVFGACSSDDDDDLIGTWYRVSDLDGLARSDASSFTIGNKGYLVCGYDGKDRKMTQVAIDAIYRFLPNEQAFIGARYNTVTARLQGFTSDVDVNRFAIAAGWYPTKNLLLKGEYVNQGFNGFPVNDIRNEGKFNGITVEAVVGF